ncbi:hypothetical protein OROHE_003089 [Orobanche hederae]
MSLDLSKNHIDGKIPQGIGALHQLRVLNLGSNLLSGSVRGLFCNFTDLVVLENALPLVVASDMEIACSTTEAFSLEIATTASRVLLGLIYVHASATETSVQDGLAFKLIGKGKKAQGENVDDGKIDDDSGQAQQYGGANGENGDTSGG